jgi:hypothetical protein
MAEARPPLRDQARAATRDRVGDRLFEAACTCLFLVLIATVVQVALPYLR